MRRVKLFSILIITLLGFLCLVTLFLPSKVTVSKSVYINAPESKVVQQIDKFKNWKNWNPDFQAKNISVIIPDSDSSRVILSDERERKFSMKMIKYGPENIGIILSSENKTPVTYQFIFSNKNTGKTLLTWNVNTTLPWYPWKKITGIFLDKIAGPQYETVLQNLKSVVEQDSH